MNLERLPNEEKLSLCRKYYLGESININPHVPFLYSCTSYSCFVYSRLVTLAVSLFFFKLRRNFELMRLKIFQWLVNDQFCQIFLFISPGGFAFLPFLWLVNVVWFFREAFLKPAYTEQLQIKACEFQNLLKMYLVFSFALCIQSCSFLSVAVLWMSLLQDSICFLNKHSVMTYDIDKGCQCEFHVHFTCLHITKCVFILFKEFWVILHFS